MQLCVIMADIQNIQEGFADYLSKPIIPAKLEKMIQKYLPTELLLKNDLGHGGVRQ